MYIVSENIRTSSSLLSVVFRKPDPPVESYVHGITGLYIREYYNFTTLQYSGPLFTKR